MTIWRTRVVYGYLTLQHLQYVIRIVLALQQCLYERASVLRYTCTVYLALDKDCVYCAVRAET
jgi:hypothetical protein